jgi:uncharacterized protein YndB with AHSA1/START domain
MMEIRLQRHINAPIETVFDAIAHIDSFQRASPSIVGVEYLSKQKRGVGTRFRETRRMGNREATTELEITEYDPPDRVRLVSQAGGAAWDTLFTVRPANNGTVLAMTMTATGDNLISRLLLPFMKKPIARAIESDLNAVKTWCEDNRGADNSGPK